MADTYYEQSVKEATAAFLKVMDLRGFSRKDDLDEFQRRLITAVEYSFYTMRGGPDEQADELIDGMLSINYEPFRSCIVQSTGTPSADT